MMKQKLYWLVAFSTFILFSFNSRAEHADTTPSAGSTPSASGIEHPISQNQLPDKEVNLISSLFEIPKKVVIERYGKSLPEAIEKARPKSEGGQGDERAISKIMAELVGTRTNAQMDAKVIPEVKAEMDKELAKAGTDKNRYLDFLKRVFWAGKVVNGEDSPKKEAQAFNKEFKKGLKDNQDELKKVYAKVKDAIAGNTAAKDYLRKTVNHDSILSFLDSQRKAGNTKAVADFASALSWNVDGKKALYVKNPQGQIKTWSLGNTPDEIVSSLKMFSDNNKGFGGFSLSLYPPLPPKVAPVTTPPTAPRSTTSQTQTPPATGANAAVIAATLGSKCAGCHSNVSVKSAANAKDIRFVKDGSEKTAADVLAALNSVPRMRNEVPEDVKATIRAWAAAQ